jgi:DNA-binding response OmpR family regulator
MKKILIIEDDAAIRENTAELLELRKYTVLTAETGSIGYALAQEHKPNLILCDLMMPETNGLEFLKLAREDTTVQNTPIIFFSAGSFAPEINLDLINGGHAYLVKPFTEEELLITIKKVLQKQNEQVV